MPNYRRVFVPGGTYFFTVNLLERRGNDLLVRHISVLREAVHTTRQLHPFKIHAWVVLPEHLHCIIELPTDDHDFSLRLRLIKHHFSVAIPKDEYRSNVRQHRRERGIWQRRFWEHVIRDEDDYGAHMNYVHYNPVKHGLVERVKDWPYSTFHRCVQAGMYPLNWTMSENPAVLAHDD
jgi:putative transposase